MPQNNDSPVVGSSFRHFLGEYHPIQPAVFLAHNHQDFFVRPIVTCHPSDSSVGFNSPYPSKDLPQ